MLVVALGLTVASLAYDFATAGRAGPPAGLRFVKAGDVRTRYLEWGSTGQPVVLIPGAFETADTFDALGQTLAVRHRVVAFDLTGLGYSQPVEPFGLEHYARQVEGLIGALHLTGADAPILVGHSSGAAIAGLVALEDQGAVSGVLFLDGDAAPLGAPAVLGRLLVNPYRTSVMRLAIRSDALIRSLYASQCGPTCAPLTSTGIQVWRRPLQQPGAEEALSEGLRHGVIPALTASELDRLRAAALPKAVVFGSDDPQYPVGTAAQVATRIGAPPPTLVPGRHLTMIAAPIQVAAAVEALTARISAIR